MTSALASFSHAMRLYAAYDGQTDDARFHIWVAVYNRNYSNESEYQLRFSEWLKKDKAYTEINNNSGNTFTVGHNNFSDWTE